MPRKFPRTAVPHRKSGLGDVLDRPVIHPVTIHLKKLFDVLYQFSLRKHSAKAVSSGFYFIYWIFRMNSTAQNFNIAYTLRIYNFW